MALIHCPACGREVSEQAQACPGCGHPLRAAGSGLAGAPVWQRLAWVLGTWLVTPWLARLVVALAVCVLAYFLFTGG
ncbi:zinc-ribbon domain-containing protein [Oryzisolibacter propanilivorax]|uniref:zinc-ribbon domain-containing protein n=1 Tax=Oryzisolibacter propanilivorax TaxID=1527607 RepID=UPI000B89BE1F|nr:zinc ribbon domain-containing protein [Oryzisolibacter propanilivorax]